MLLKHKELMDSTAHAFVKQTVQKASAERYVSASCGLHCDSVVMSNLEPILSPFPASQSLHTEPQYTSSNGVCVLTNGAGCSFPLVRDRFPVISPGDSKYSTPATVCRPTPSNTQAWDCETSLGLSELMMSDGLLNTDTVGDTTVTSRAAPYNWLQQPVSTTCRAQSADSTADPKRSLIYHKELLKKISEHPVCPIQALGDNLDILKNPASMTKERQRESLHWFLLLIANKRITNVQLPNDSPKADISTLEHGAWLPTPAELNKYEKNVSFHIARVLVKYLDFMQPYADCLPAYISHPFLDQSSQKSEVLNVELIDAPENSTEGIIRIIKRLNELLVPTTGGTDAEVIDRIVLGGDVLTNERAFEGQGALANADNEADSCCGIVHRPEGLHRLMNLTLVTPPLFTAELQFSSTELFWWNAVICMIGLFCLFVVFGCLTSFVRMRVNFLI